MLLLIMAPFAWCNADLHDLRLFTDFSARNLLIGDGNTLAWIETRAGVTNLWASDRAAPARRLTNFTEVDDGLEVTVVRLVDARRQILFTVGPISGANVGSLVDGTPLIQTWVVSLDGTFRPRVVCNATLLELSQNGASVLYTASSSRDSSKQALWEVDTMSDTIATQLFQVQKGTIQGLAWRRDGAQDDVLAFTNMRITHSFIGLYRRGAGRLVWVAPAADSDTFPVWSPGGARLAWVRARASPTGYGAFDGDQAHL